MRSTSRFQQSKSKLMRVKLALTPPIAPLPPIFARVVNGGGHALHRMASEASTS
jgi:hypothetical protein